MEILNQKNQQEVIDFIHNNLKRSGFIYGNLQSEYAQTYIFRDHQEIIAITNIYLERYCTYLLPSTLKEETIEMIITTMLKYPHIGGTVVGQYQNILAKYYQLPQNHCNDVAILSLKHQLELSSTAEYLSQETADLYWDALKSIDEFPKNNYNYVLQTLKDGKIAVLVKDDIIIAGASLVAISNDTAVITSVFTIEAYRGHGYAKQVVRKLLEDYGPNRAISIFFTNPIAAKIYLELGFEITDQLIMFNRPLT